MAQNTKKSYGQLIYESLKSKPEHILQIDGYTGESITNGETLELTVKLAKAMKAFGLKLNDVVTVMSPCHVQSILPIYAGLMIGAPVNIVDITLVPRELTSVLEKVRPKLIFCQSSKYSEVCKVSVDLELYAIVVTFDESDYDINIFIQQFDTEGNYEDFRPSVFDINTTYALIASTSGSTGQPKAVALTHDNLLSRVGYNRDNNTITLDSTIRDGIFLSVSPLQWVSTQIFSLDPLGATRLHTSAENLTHEHVIELINSYKPTCCFMAPTFASALFNDPNIKKCNVSSIKYIATGGSYVSKDLQNKIKELIPGVKLHIGYGMTETSGIVLLGVKDQPEEAIGKECNNLEFKLVNHEDGTVITTPYVTGELWVRGPSVIKSYYNDPELSLEVFSPDHWYKSGDLLYKDHNGFYYFVDRIKSMFMYKTFRISPVEVENVIRELKGILDVCVTSVTSEECGDLLVACCIVDDRYTITAQDVKDIVKNNLTDLKQLRGGVVFMKNFPLLPTQKIDRKKLKSIVLSLNRE